MSSVKNNSIAGIAQERVLAGVKQIAALSWVAFASTASGSEARRLECYSVEDRSRASGLVSPGVNASGPCEGGLRERTPGNWQSETRHRNPGRLGGGQHETGQTEPLRSLG
jgi:hypothetical protein